MDHAHIVDSSHIPSGIRCVYTASDPLVVAWMNDPDTLERVEYQRSMQRYESQVAVVSRSVLTPPHWTLYWTDIPYAYLAAASNHEGHPTPHLFAQLSFHIHVKVREGWVATRRSPHVSSGSGWWQPAVAELAEPEDLIPIFDPTVCGDRGLREELNIHTEPSRFSWGGAAYAPLDAAKPYVTIAICCDLSDMAFAQLESVARTAPDAWERDRIAVYDPTLCVPYVSGFWSPLHDSIARGPHSNKRPS